MEAQTNPNGNVDDSSSGSSVITNLNDNLRLWLDATDKSTLYTTSTVVSGQSISELEATNPENDYTGTEIKLWLDKSGYHSNVSQTDATRFPTYVADGGTTNNNNPTIEFLRTEKDNLNITLPVTNSGNGEQWESDYTVFIVFEQLTDGNIDNAFFSNGNTYADDNHFQISVSAATGDDFVWKSNNNADVNYLDFEHEKQNELKLYSVRADNSGTETLVDGINKDFDATLTNNGRKFYAYNINRNRNNNSFNDSRISEVIIYDRALTDCELDEVNKYLGSKYGKDFSSSFGALFNSDTDTDFNNTKAGIGLKEDICGGTEDKRNTATSNGMTLTVDNADNTVNRNYITFSDNNGANTINDNAPKDTNLKRLDKAWMLQEFGNNALGNQALDFQFDIPTIWNGMPESSFAILIDDDGDFSNAEAIGGGTINSGKITFNNITLGTDTTFDLDTTTPVYITLAIQTAPGGIFGNLQGWWKADGQIYSDTGTTLATNSDPIYQWSDVSINGNDFIQGNSGKQPIFSEAGLNFNPQATFDGTQFMDGNGTTGLPNGNSARFIRVVTSATASFTGNHVAFSHGGPTQNEAHIIGGTSVNEGLLYSSWEPINDITSPNFWTINKPNIIGGGYDGNTTSYLQANGTTLIADSDGNPTWSTVNSILRLGADVNSTADEFWTGNIAEVIVYDTYPSGTEQQKVDSYLALKYGISLDQTSGTNYLASDDTVIWDASNNTGYKTDIFGIGRDDNSGLNQKISKSVNDDATLIVSLDADFTSENNDPSRTTDHINDKQFLMVANNGAALTTQVTELEAVSGFNIRLAREWKVEATNFSQNISLKFEGYDDTWSLVKDDDGDFSTGVTTLGTLDSNGEISGVTLADGDYFTLAKVVEGPGGIITNLSLWLKADSGATPAQWDDQSEFNNNLVQASSDLQPMVKSNGINFNPTVVFDGSDLMQTGAGVMTSTELVNANSNNANSQFIVFKSTGAPGTIYNYSNSPGGSYSTGAGTNGNLFLTNRYGNSGAVNNDIAYLRVLRGNNITATVRAEGAFAANVIGSNSTLSEGFFNLGSEGTNGLYPFTGEIAEIINYREDVTLNINRIESYLALKYGITLNQNSENDYLDSDGTVVWDASENIGYDTDIFGIGRDDISGLDQRVSKSTNTGSILTMALDSNFTTSNTDASRTTKHTNDKQFIVIANNGEATSDTYDEIDGTNYNVRISREWKIDKSANFGQSINLKFDGFDGSWTLLKDSDGDFSSGVSSLGTLDSNGEITGITLTDGDYLTLAKFVSFPGGVVADLKLWLKADSGASGASWVNQAGGGNATQINASSQPTPSTSELLNFNPSMVFDGIDDYFRVDRSASLIGISSLTTFYITQTNAGSANVYHHGTSGGANFGNVKNTWFHPIHEQNASGVFKSWGEGIYGSIISYVQFNRTQLFAHSYETTSGAIKTYADGLIDLNTTTVTNINRTNTDDIIGTGRNNDGVGGTEQIGGFYNGKIGEVIGYTASLSTTDVQKVNSYLALKYGISLDQTSPLDYLASDDTVIWDGTANASYNTDIFGIGRDDASGLNQKVSKSANSGDILTIDLDANFTKANNDVTRATSHANDKQFLIISNNGGAITTQTTEILPSSYNTRVTREWKIDKTVNFSQNINLKFDGFDETWVLIKDDDGDFSTGITTLGDLDSNGEITDVTLADGDYLTLAKNDVIVPTITSFSPESAGNGEVVTITGTGFTGTSAVTFGGVNAKSFTVNSDIEIVATVNTGTSGDITITNSAGNDTATGFLYKVAQYDFEGDVLDETDNNYDGTEVNVVTYETGAQGQAVCFDNGPGFVKLPDNLIRNLSEFTISLRFRTTAKGAILGYQNTEIPANSPNHYIPIIMIDNDGKLKGTLWTSADNSIQTISSDAVNDGNWHQVDFTASSNTITIYLDGNVEASSTGASVAHLDMSYNQLGLSYTNNYNTTPTTFEYFEGCIDDMVIIDKALTAQELEENTALPEPTIASFDPVEAGQEDTVVITGTNFDGATQVTFGGIDAASYTVDSSTQITAVLGITAASGDVEVITAGGTATLSGFTFTSKSELTLSTNTLNEIIYCANETSASESFQVSGTDLYEDLVITAPAGFEVSLSNGSGYANSVSLTPSSNAVTNTTIYVRVASSQNGELSGNITVASGTESENIAVSAANNNALYFDGNNDYVTLSGNTIADGASNFTIETWILPDNTNWNGEHHAIIGYQAGGTSNTRNPSFYIIDGKIHVDMYDNTLNRYDFLTDDAVVLQNVWTHLALVKESTEYRFYVNGQLILTRSAPENINIVGAYNIGYVDNYFAGKIDDIRFWNTPRTQTQIEDNMNVTLNGDEAGLVGYYTFNQGTAEGNNTSLTTLYDKSLSGINGVLNNMSLTGSTSNWVDGYFAQITGSSSVYKNETLQLSHTQSGGVWSSDDTGIATVNQSGLVTGVSAGSVNINYALCGQTTYKSVSIIDAGFSVSETTLTISENAGTAEFTVVLDDVPTSDVVFAISSNDTNEATVDKSTLTFTSTNWDTPQTIIVTGVDDDIDRDDTATITVSVNDASSANGFDALADKSVVITLTDNDTAAFTVSETALTINEDAGTDSFTVVLDTEPTSDVVFNISSDNTNEATVDKSQLTFTTSNWNTAQTVTVTGVDDTTATNDTATITISVNDASSDNTFDNLTDKTVTITLTNDDANFTINAIANANVNENTAYTSVEPTLSGDTPIGTITYTLSGNDATDFTINSSTGVVSMIARDYENPADANTDNIYELTITATDSDGNNDSESWTVTVDDVTETVAFTINAISDTNINENTAYTSVTPALSGATPIGSVTYTLSGNDSADFTINSSTGVVSMIARDFENPADANSDNVYELTITATDSDGNNDSENWTVTVNDVTETVVFTIDAISDVNVNENTAYTSVEPTLSGDTPIGTVTYTLSGNDATGFTINSSTGVVSMVARDYENPVDANTDNIYEVSITATDSDGNSDSETWTVVITDVNEIAGDTNGDGSIGAGEIAGDVNGDGTIGTGEVAGDTNGDGTIGAGEVAGDVNGDGTIGSGEITGDTNGDGTIGSGEVEGDINGDGTLANMDFENITFSMYPNPADSIVYLTFGNTTSSNFIDIKIYNAIGQSVLVKRKKIKDHKMSLDISTLPSGTYFLNINDETKVISKKLVIN